MDMEAFSAQKMLKFTVHGGKLITNKTTAIAKPDT